jgi:hypothetical protein
MNTRYDHKGKYFTEVKRKVTIRVRIQTGDMQVTGTIHVQPDLRLLDEINHGDDFIPVTDAELDFADSVVHTPFIALNRNLIHWIIPIDEENQDYDD